MAHWRFKVSKTRWDSTGYQIWNWWLGQEPSLVWKRSELWWSHERKQRVCYQRTNNLSDGEVMMGNGSIWTENHLSQTNFINHIRIHCSLNSPRVGSHYSQLSIVYDLHVWSQSVNPIQTGRGSKWPTAPHLAPELLNGQQCGIQTSGLFLSFACGHFHEKIFSPVCRYAWPPVHREKSIFWNSDFWPLCDTSLESID